MKYCNNCEQHVEPDGKVNWLIFILLFLFMGVPGIVYLLYCVLLKSKSCPQCGASNWGAPKDHEDEGEEE